MLLTFSRTCTALGSSDVDEKQRQRLYNLRDIGNHLARVHLDHCVRLAISENSITDELL
jgi:hypothetical protein